MTTVQIEIDSRWVPRMQSTWFAAVQSLQGVSLSFCPLFIYWAGGGMPLIAENPVLKWSVLGACGAIILAVQGTNLSLVGEVVRAIRRTAAPSR